MKNRIRTLLAAALVAGALITGGVAAATSGQTAVQAGSINSHP
ncbi:hypothetical protein ACFCYC_14315 [Streptomyces sp. NPDC056402]